LALRKEVCLLLIGIGQNALFGYIPGAFQVVARYDGNPSEVV